MNYVDWQTICRLCGTKWNYELPWYCANFSRDPLQHKSKDIFDINTTSTRLFLGTLYFPFWCGSQIEKPPWKKKHCRFKEKCTTSYFFGPCEMDKVISLVCKQVNLPLREFNVKPGETNWDQTQILHHVHGFSSLKKSANLWEPPI